MLIPSDFIEHHPRTALVAVLVGFLMAGVAIADMEARRPEAEAANAAWWKAKLECRQSGKSYENFGPAGYACVSVCNGNP